MANIQTAVVRLSADEYAASRAFWERNPLHELVNPELENGDVFLTDEQPVELAYTDAVRRAIDITGRLELVEEVVELEFTADDVTATDAAADLAEEAGLDLATVTPTGKNNTITKADVQRAIKAAKEG